MRRGLWVRARSRRVGGGARHSDGGGGGLGGAFDLGGEDHIGGEGEDIGQGLGGGLGHGFLQRDWGEGLLIITIDSGHVGRVMLRVHGSACESKGL